MSQTAKANARRDTGELIRDGIAGVGVLCSSVGAGIQFGAGYGLMTFGGICLALVMLGSVRK